MYALPHPPPRNTRTSKDFCLGCDVQGYKQYCPSYVIDQTFRGPPRIPNEGCTGLERDPFILDYKVFLEKEKMVLYYISDNKY